MIEIIKRLIDERAYLSSPSCDLALDGDLYEAGLTPFAAIQLLLALETAFEIEFPERMLNRRSVSSIARVISCIREVQADEASLRAA
ncbi:MAG TPA: acyl carrier protein [Methylosinus sp.]|jgi:acyl carrier protein|uniref:acyl carrier protein n=1 Tax=Methylosinus sp. TaxID=427 RepID=UPI002F93FD05